MQTPTQNRAPKSPRPFQIHLARLKEALGTIGITVPAAKLQGLAAAFYGYRTGNALADALKSGDLAVPPAVAGHGSESLAVLIDPVAGRPFGVVVPEDANAFVGSLVTTPYGNLVTVPPFDTRTTTWPGEGMRQTQLRMARNALQAYAGASLDWIQPETAIQDLIGDLLRYRNALQERDEADEDKTTDVVAEDALRCYLRECLGEIAHASEPDIRVEIDALDWNLAWTRGEEACITALKAYAPNSFESEPDYIVGDLITDLLHVTAMVNHGSPVEVLRAALRTLAGKTDPESPQITVDIRVGR